MLLPQTSDVGPRNIDTHEIDQLAGAMGEARERPSRRAVLEIELDLAYAISRANRVDRHAHLHAEVGCEGQHVPEQARAQRPLPRDRSPHVEAAAPADRPTRKADGQPEPSSHASLEGRHREVGLTGANRIDERPQPSRRASQVAIAEEEPRFAPLNAGGWLRRLLERRERGLRDRAALADHPLAAHDPRPRLAGDLGRAIGRAVVRHPHLGAGKRPRQRPESGSDALSLVVVGHDDERVRRHGSVGGGGYCHERPAIGVWRLRWLWLRPISRARYGKSSARWATPSRRATPWRSSSR